MKQKLLQTISLLFVLIFIISCSNAPAAEPQATPDTAAAQLTPTAQPAAAEKGDALRVGFFPIEPHTIVESPGTYKGAAVEYFSRLAKSMGVSNVSFQDYPLARLTSSLEEGKIDVILFLAKNPEREGKFRFPEQPYYFSQSGVAVVSSSPLQAVSSVEDLLPLKIGILSEGYLSPLARDERLQLEPMSGGTPIRQNLEKLTAGRIDAAYVPDLAVIRFEALKYGYDTQVRYLPFPEPSTANYTVFSPQSAETYLARYEQALQELQETLPYEQFLEEYIATAKPD